MVEDIEDPRRIEPGFIQSEREMLEAWLEYHRTTLLLKCEGLDDAAAQEPAGADLASCRCTVWSGTWPRSSGTGSAACCCASRRAADLVRPRDRGQRARPARRRRLGRRPRRVAAPSATHSRRGRGRARPRRHGHAARRAVLAALDLRPHDRGVRAPQRARRPHPRAHRRKRRLVAPI